MTQITLTIEQNIILSNSQEPVAVCRPDGSVVGFVSPTVSIMTPTKCPFTSEEIAAAEIEAESDGPWHTTQEVMAHLRSLSDSQQ
jgi:hypothetical protein